MNCDGIPDVLQGGVQGGVQVQHVQQVQQAAYIGEPMAAVGVDVNHDVRADYIAVGADRSLDGMYMQQQQRYVVSGGTMPMAAACVTGVDMNCDGIPDVLQGGVQGGVQMAAGGYPVVGRACPAPMAAACVTGVDMNRDGIPDVLQQPRYV